MLNAVLTKTAKKAGPGLVNTVRILAVLLLHVLQVSATSAIQKRIFELAHWHRLGRSLSISPTALEVAIAAEERRSAPQLSGSAPRCHSHRHGDTRDSKQLCREKLAQTSQKVSDKGLRQRPYDDDEWFEKSINHHSQLHSFIIHHSPSALIIHRS